MGLFVGDGVFDGLGDFVDVGVLGEFADVGVVGFGVKSHFAGHAALHVKGGGHFFFGEQEDLQHEVVTLFGAAGETVLADQDEAGCEDRLHRDDALEQREWTRVEVVMVVDAVQRDPGGKEEQVRGDEGQASNPGGHGVGEAFGSGALGEELLFVFRNEVDLFLNVLLGHGTSVVHLMRST